MPRPAVNGETLPVRSGNKTHKQCVGSIFTVFEERENRPPPRTSCPSSLKGPTDNFKLVY